jgi:hypothetical protein
MTVQRQIGRAILFGASACAVIFLASGKVAGQPSVTKVGATFQQIQGSAYRTLSTSADSTFAIPESGGLLILGSAFAVVARQLRRRKA